MVSAGSFQKNEDVSTTLCQDLEMRFVKDDHMTCLDKFNSRSDQGQGIKTLSKILG